jgi:hypothetical protein
MWWKDEPAQVRSLFDHAVLHAERASALVPPESELSHVGFRTLKKEEWFKLIATAYPYGELYITEKDDRDIVFIRLERPLKLEAITLDYLEFPEPAKVPDISKSPVVVAFRHPRDISKIVDGNIEVRQSPYHARDFIARAQDTDKGR